MRAGRDPLGGEPLLAGEALRVGQRLVAGGRVGPHCFHPFSPPFNNFFFREDGFPLLWLFLWVVEWYSMWYTISPPYCFFFRG